MKFSAIGMNEFLCVSANSLRVLVDLIRSNMFVGVLKCLIDSMMSLIEFYALQICTNAVIFTKTGRCNLAMKSKSTSQLKSANETLSDFNCIQEHSRMI